MLLKMQGIKKSFGATKALKGVDLIVNKGEVHAIVGSNGAGKSTLMKTLAGEYIPDEGKLFFMGEDITGLTPRKIQGKGIEVVHQVLNIVDSMSIMENIMLACPPLKNNLLTWKDGQKQVEDVQKLIGIDFNLKQPAGTLSISEQQFVIIARALISNPKLLVLDEPTSRIGLHETQKLFALIEKLKQSGTTTIYISHRMEEIYKICDTISVFRDGTHIETRLTKDFPEDELVASMLGKKLDAFFPKVEAELSGEALRVEDLRYQNKLNGISFSVQKGEIVSIVGAVGAGKTEILNCVYGILRPDGGKITVDNKLLPSHNTPAKAIANAVALVPEDRALQGMIGNTTIAHNVTSINMKNIAKLGLIRNKTENELAKNINDRLQVVPNDIHYIISKLSGGNQQKVVIGKWLIDEYALYLLDEVAAGVDIGAKSQIYTLLGELVKRGAGVLLATGDIEEAMGLSDRIIVIYKGKIIKEVRPSEITKDELLFYIMGGNSNEQQAI